MKPLNQLTLSALPLLPLQIGDIAEVGLIGILIGLVLLAIWIWALVDAIRSHFPNDIEKIIWVLAIIFLPVIGVILYVIIGRNRRTSRYHA